MGEVVRFPGSKRPHYITKSANKSDIDQMTNAELIAKIKAEIAAHDVAAGYTKIDPLAPLIRIRDELRARRAAEIAAHGTVERWLEKFGLNQEMIAQMTDYQQYYDAAVKRYREKHPDGDDAA